jgi:2-oxoglutarate ferredoxin oxidoreductase subunit alpha
MMQARWGSHGDNEIIALVPSSPQECFDLMIKAFNLSELYRCPVMFMMDEVVGHMVERVEIPPRTPSKSSRASSPPSPSRTTAPTPPQPTISCPR